MSFADDKTAAAIFSDMVAKYRNAPSYSDKAVLYMSYRMDGRPIQEPQPWSISIDEGGLFSAGLFNAQVTCDGKQLSCYVYDIGSGNLDNQRLLLPVESKLPIEELYSDEIAHHFIAGYSEMPLDNELPKIETQLVPPTIGLLTGMLSPRWLNPNVRIERFEDSVIDERECFVLRCWQSENETDFVDLWIDKAESILWQAGLPTTFLAGKVRTSPEITNLRLVARFHDASFESKVASKQFELKARLGATAVKQFVKIPESLPADSIGTRAVDFGLLTQSGKTLTRDDFGRRTTTLMWISNSNNLDAIYKLDELAKPLKDNSHNFGVVYSEPHRASYETDVHSMNMALHEAARNTGVSFYYDKDMVTSAQLRIKTLPAVLILDKKGGVQFAATVKEGWQTDVAAAIERIDRGEDIADEMLAEYTQYLEAYHRKLLEVGVSENGQQSAVAHSPNNVDGNRAKSANVQTSGRMTAQRIWTNSQLKLPGDIAVIDATQDSTKAQDERIFVMDGWRTVVELDSSGKRLQRFELDLPDGIAVSLIQKSGSNHGSWAAFMPQGKQVFVFDKSWDLLWSTEIKNEHRVADAQWEKGQLKVAFSNGDVQQFEGQSGESVKSQSLNASALVNASPLFVSDGALVNPDGNAFDSKLANWQIQRAYKNGNQICCIGSNAEGKWFAIGTGSETTWTYEIGSQDFERNLSPVSSNEKNAGVASWAVADANNRVHLFSRVGNWLGSFQCDSTVCGISLRGDSRQSLLVSTSQGVSRWNVDFSTTAKLPSNSR